MPTQGVGPNGNWQGFADQAASSGGGQGGLIISMLWADRPPAASVPGQLRRFIDIAAGQSTSGGGAVFISNGARWKPLNNDQVVDGIDTRNVGVAGPGEQILTSTSVLQPAGLIGVSDKLDLDLTASKTGTSESCIIRVRLGQTRTSADALLTQITSMAGANQSFANRFVFKRIGATTMQKMGNGDPAGGYNGPSLSALPAATTIANLDNVGVYLSISAEMSGAAEIPAIEDMRLKLLASDNM